MRDSNVERVKLKLALRAERGLSKYGVTTERDDLSEIEWLSHAQDELMDGAVYLERLINDKTQLFHATGQPLKEPMNHPQTKDWLHAFAWAIAFICATGLAVSLVVNTISAHRAEGWKNLYFQQKKLTESYEEWTTNDPAVITAISNYQYFNPNPWPGMTNHFNGEMILK